MITLADFYMGRDKTYASELTDAMRANAQVTVDRANLLLSKFYAANPSTHKRGVNSGWRPADINGYTPGAATHSKHMTCQAIDIEDKDGLLKSWTTDDILAECQLWREAPQSTPSWQHCQIVAPGSGKRTFIP